MAKNHKHNLPQQEMTLEEAKALRASLAKPALLSLFHRNKNAMLLRFTGLKIRKSTV